MSLTIRGLHLDPARRFLNIDTVLNIIKYASKCYINVLHLHLTDDQGIAFESKTLDFHEGWTIKEQHKLYKTCKKYNINIIPEIDIPGHTFALRSILDDGKYVVMGRMTDMLGQEFWLLKKYLLNPNERKP